MISFIVCIGGNAEETESAYIPYDVADAVRELDHLLSDEAKSEGHLRSKPVGMQIRNRWKLWNHESRLARYFYVKGIYNADLMWEVIRQSFVERAEHKQGDLRKIIGGILSMYTSGVNRPAHLGELPNDFDGLHVSHYILRDDFSALHVFSSHDGIPQKLFSHDAGWMELDDSTLKLLEEPSTIKVPQRRHGNSSNKEP